MKNFNLIKRLWTDSHEKQTPQRFGRYAAMLLMLLTLGVGQMWADPWVKNDVSTGKQATKTVGDKLNGGSEWWYNYQTNGGWSSATDIQVLIGTSSSSYSTVNASWYEDSGSDKKVHADIGSFTFNKSGIWYAVGKYYASSKTAYTSGTSFTNNSSLSTSMSTSNSPYWEVTPPAVSSFTITPSGEGYVSGTGTSDDPYIIHHSSGNLTLTISGSQAVTDANSVAEYSVDGGSSWSTSTDYVTIYRAFASTSNKSKTLKMRYKNSSASLTGTESSFTAYYKIEQGYTLTKWGSTTGGSYSVPSSAGAVSGGIVSATPNTGYNFGAWSVTSGSGTWASSTSTASNTFYPTSNSTLKATFTAKNYSVKLDKNGGDSDGSITTTYNSTSCSSFSAASRAGYSCDGYFTASDGGSKVINSDGTLVSGTVSGWLSSGTWVKNAASITLYAHWTVNATNYTVTYGVKSDQTSLGSLSCATTVGGTSIDSGDEVASGTGVTFTASPITGYQVDGWWRNAACTQLIVNTNSNTFTPTITQDTTVYVKFAKKSYSITYSPSSAPTGCTYTTKPTTGTYGNTVTMVITPSTGYTVSVSARDASSNVVTISNPSTNTYTFTQPASAVTVTVSTSQIMSTLSTSCHYDVGTPGYAIPTKSVSSIGVATTATVTATAAGTGYTFAGWTLTNCTRTDGGGATANPITVRANGDGAAATVVANYTEDLSSPYTIKGGTNLTGNDWSTAYDMVKKTGHSTESVAYYTFNISSTNSGSDANKDSFGFKIINGSDWYGLAADGVSYWWTSSTTANKTLSTSGKNIQICANVAGPYEVKIDYSTPASPTVTVTFPTSYTLTYSIGSVNGTSGSISTSPTTASGSKVLSGNTVTLTGPAPKTGYSWKGWYTNAAGTEGKIADTDRAITVTMNADKTLYACYTENQWNVAVSAGAGGSVSPTGTVAVKQVTGTSLTATPSAGYSFNNWTISGGGITPNPSSTNPQTFKATTTGGTIRANFSEVMRTVTVAVNNSYLGSVSTTSLTSVGPATASAEVTATPVAGATFTGWTLPSGTSAASTYTSSSNPIKINATAADKTITANFTETMHTVSMSSADGTKGTVGAASASVGQITAVQITATPKSGYMFSAWVKVGGSGTVTYYTGPGNGQLTDASGEEKETTYICVTGNVTLQATWAPDRSSGYVVYYGNDGKDADGNSAPSMARPWKDGKLYRASTAESDISYFTFTAGIADVDKVIEFKVHKLDPSTWYGYNSASGGKITGDISNVALNTSYGNGRICITMPGSYLFTWNKSTNKLSIAYPTDVYYLRGGFNSWDWSHPMTETSSGVYSATVNMTEANHTYSGDAGFKVLIAGDYYGKNSTTVTRSSSTGSAAISGCNTSGANIGITTDYTGDYTFTYTVLTNTLQVTYPTAYKITFGKGSVNGSASNCSAVNLDNGNSAVTSNSTWVKSGHRVKLTAPAAKSGYTYDGWFSNNAGTGVAITTEANCTTTVNAADITRYACYHENMTTVTLVASPAGKGTFTVGSTPNQTSTTAGKTTTRSVTAVAGTGYRVNTSADVWTKNNSNITLNNVRANPVTVTGGGSGGTSTLTATFTPITYTIAFNANGGSGSMSNQGFTYDAAQALTSNAFTKTGYNFAGWAESAGGSVVYTNGQSVSNLSSTQGATVTLFAKWTPKQSALTLDQQTSATGYGSAGTATASASATYGSAMPALTGTLPTAANGYAFMGFYDATDGGGTKYYNADGTSAHNWDKDVTSGTTLYAYYKKAEITALTFDALSVEASGAVGVTPTIDPTPVGDKIICWTVLQSNDSPLDPQPADMTFSDGKLTFTAPAYSGTYKVQAVLRTGTSCGGGTVLDTRTESFTVAGSHTVTINYKCGDDVIKASTSVTGRPFDWSEDITAPDIFGYTFTRWDAVDGVTIKNGDSDPVTTSTDATIKIKATYHGKLTASYTQKNMIFFKNTLGWSDVYVNFYTGSYWNNPKGSGNQSVTNRNKHMTQYGETDIWYYDYGAAGITPGLYVSFTSDSQDNAQYFWKLGGVNVVYPANYPDAINTDKSSENGFKAATPMFVPLEIQDPVTLNHSSGGKADYYNAGYWTKYTPGTGYRLEIYNNSTGAFIKAQDFTSEDELMPMKAVVDLEGGQTYKFQLRRGGESSAGIYYGNTGTMTYANHGQGTPWDMTNTMSPSFSMARITTNATGSYTFHLSYSGNSATPPHYRLRMAVDYPIASGDYQLIYSDDVQTSPLTSAIVSKANDRKDTVSFFVRPGSTPVLRIQQATVNPSTGAVTWNEYPTSGTPTNQITGTIATTITSGGTEVYNFNLSMNGSGALSIASVEKYTGNFYIRTDAANSKWDNYKSDPDHLMTYSEYSIEHGGYTHYYCHWVKSSETGRKNVKFCIANDYSPNISETLTRETASGTWANIDYFMTEGGDLKRDANVRFMWDKRDNSISRAYVDGAQGDWSANFLYMLNVEAGADKIRNTDESALTDHKITFKDNGNWMYEANIQAQPNAKIKLLSNWGTSNTITQYFRGGESSTETLLGGSGTNWYEIRVIYDFKTNRLIAGLIPSGEIDEQMAIHADVMFIREHQGDIAQLTFAEKGGKMGAITDIETAYGVLRFNKWTINNKSKAAGHAPLDPLLSRFERDLFYVSFPFRVSMEEVFGFGTYGTHWIIEYYDGANRAANGYWLESDPNWKFIWDRKGKFFEPGTGYIIALELDELDESSSVWANTDQVELFFPSYGSMSNITSSTATYNIPAHECTINRSHESNGHGGTLGDAYDRRVKDSHWNVLGVPTYVNPDAPDYANTAWITTADSLHIGPNFLYQVNWNDNTVSPVSASTFTYHAMHAYLVQYCGNVTWTSSVSVNPSAAPRRNPAYRGEYEFRLEMLQNDEAVDQTFVKLSDNEAVTTGFEFNYDMSKEFNKKKANIYTLIGTEQVAGNVLPLTEQTTVVPVGVQIKANGEYTFSMPEGTEGIGVTLIDNETGLRTQLGLTDYTISLEAGTYDDRFVLEIAPIKGTATDIEEAVSDQHSAIRKVMVDGILYIVKDGKVFDARGNRVR